MIQIDDLLEPVRRQLSRYWLIESLFVVSGHMQYLQFGQAVPASIQLDPAVAAASGYDRKYYEWEAADADDLMTPPLTPRCPQGWRLARRSSNFVMFDNLAITKVFLGNLWSASRCPTALTRSWSAHAQNRLDVGAYQCADIAARSRQNDCVHLPRCGRLPLGMCLRETPKQAQGSSSWGRCSHGKRKAPPERG